MKLINNKNKTLNRTIQRRGKKITNLKTLFTNLKTKNVLENDAASRLANEFGTLVLPVLKNEKRNKDKPTRGRRYCEEDNI